MPDKAIKNNEIEHCDFVSTMECVREDLKMFCSPEAAEFFTNIKHT